MTVWIAFLLGFLACYPVTEAVTAAAFWYERRYATKHPGKVPLSADPRGRPLPRRDDSPDERALRLMT